MSDPPLRPTTPNRSALWGPAIGVTLLGFVVAWWFMEPAPPKRVVIASGRRDGAYHRFATEYAAHLAEKGITVEVRETAGSGENFRLLLDDPDVHLAIVQGGTAPKDVELEDRLETITGLYLEPVWIFVRNADGPVPREIRELHGRRIAVGEAESGTRAAADELFAANGIADGEEGTTYVSVGGGAAVEQLRAGEIDAMFLVVSVTNPLVEELLADESLATLPLVRNEAYRRRFPYVSAVTLPEGVVDFERNLPRENLPMIAPVAQLVATPELHEAFVPLLLEAARATHERGDVLTEPGEFPSTKFAEFPVNAAARRWFHSGTSFLFRWLPFGVASALDRGKILLLPALTLLLPLIKLAPPIIRWRIRQSIYKWYTILREVDEQARDGADAAQLRKHLDTLATMQRELDDVSVPLSYMEEFYNLRVHLDLVRRTLAERLAARGEEDEEAGEESAASESPAA